MKTGRYAASLFAFCAAALLAACGGRTEAPKTAGAPPAAPAGAPAGSLEWAVAGDWRIPSEKARDPWRHPVETLKFFGVKPSDTVVELYPGGGWYTAILGPYLKSGGGHLIAAVQDPAGSTEAANLLKSYTAAFKDHPERYGDIAIATTSKTAAGVAPDGSADVVLTFRNIHNWMAGGYAEKIFADAYKALKPGGVLGVEEHRLPSSRDQDLSASSGYVLQSYVVQLAEHAGFKLEEASEINANPKDNADHPLGVWMLPPNLRAPKPGSPEAKDYDVEKYKAIGESDRMTLRFRKPADAAPPNTPAGAPAPTPAPH
ncbi:MAG TPA: hypothetical protein VG942_03065 [Hyphomonadaceae bacterium]|nr:hypothetical protein [Hyphomonadaceae bacterium]